jgi:hypothetical protein
MKYKNTANNTKCCENIPCGKHQIPAHHFPKLLVPVQLSPGLLQLPAALPPMLSVATVYSNSRILKFINIDYPY